MLLNGKTAVITGVLKGIGNSTMQIFAENGANIIALAQFEDDGLTKQMNELSEKYNIKIIPFYCDLADENSIKTAMKSVFSLKMPIDILVNVAGMTHNALFTMTTMDSFRKIMEIDFFSQMLISQYIAKMMMKTKSGSIINVSSITGMDGNHGQIAYSAAKGALISATKTMAIELGEHGIRVNAVAPGVIETSMTRDLTPEKFAELLVGTSLNRAGKPEEVANVMLYLASDLSSYVTGQIIRIDGGKA